MARRMSKSENTAFGFIVVIGLIGVGIVKFFENIGYLVPSVIVAVITALYFISKTIKKRQRLSYLRERYKDEELVSNIFDGYFWQGQTAGQLIDSLGEPVEVDKKVLKTKKKEIWKYTHQGANRFGLRITLENDIVIGWDKKA